MITSDATMRLALLTSGEARPRATVTGSAIAEAAPIAPVAPAQPASQESVPLTKETVEAVAAHIQEYLDRNGRKLEFHLDDTTGKMVIAVRDSHTGELIRQIPNEEVLEVAKRMIGDSGTLFDKFV
jgi:flagellar protein FlaG